MARFLALISPIIRDHDDGQGLAEYGLILTLIAIVAVISVIFLGGTVSTMLDTVGKSV
jgi:pilus assembly protein Flp/PilA